MTASRREFLRKTGLVMGATALPAWTLDGGEAVAAEMDKANFSDIALATAKDRGASYADIRINRQREEELWTREQQVQYVSRTTSYGFGVRVIVDGAWGFAASRLVTPEEIRRVTEQAVAIAKANATYVRSPVELAPADKAQGAWTSAFKKNPFEISVDDKLQFLLKLNEAALAVKGVSFVNSGMTWVDERKFFASSEGSRIEQYLVRGQPYFEVTAVDRAKGDYQSRATFRTGQSMGYEYIEAVPWFEEAQQAGEEAVQKLTAKPAEPGKYDLVLHPTNLWLPIHESVGHSTELDRALWWEADYAGTSFLTPDKAGKLKFGSPMVNFVADRLQPTGLATVGYDDEGVPAKRWPLVKDGIFVDWQTTRDLAPLIGQPKSHGCLYADSWGSVPISRMPNVSLQPGEKDVSLEELVSGVKRGILIHGTGSWSIDQQRYNFQFGGQVFREIKDGKIGGMLRDVIYQARTTDFWGAIDGLGGPSTYEIGGAFTCGKGEPTQLAPVSHGCPVARIRNINVLNSAASKA
jgi:TldD protein